MLITSDQQRKDSLGVYDPNGAAISPNLDALAADGVVFDRAYTPHATCTPARASILSGQYASRHGAYTIGTTTPEDSLKVTDLLIAAGYRTYGIGKMHFQPVSTEGKFESPPRIFDEQFWRDFDGPYYGFQWTRMLNRHTSEEYSCRMRYGVWLKDRGLTETDLEMHFNRQLGTWSLPRELHPSVFVADHAIEAFQNHRNSDEPFFMWASFQDPHSPHVVPPPYDRMIEPDQIEYLGLSDGEFDNKPPIYRMLYERGGRKLPFSDRFGVPSCGPARVEQADRWRQSAAIHHGMVTLMDEEIGRMIAALKEYGLFDNTLVIFTTDHGEYLGNHGFRGKGFPAYEEVYNVPFIVKNPGQMNAGERSHALVGTLDIAPTALAAAGEPIPEGMQGVDQGEVFAGQQKAARESYQIEDRAVQTGFYQKMLVTDQHKIVVYMDEEYGELYDLGADPDQYNNLWDSQANSELKHALLEQLCRSAGGPEDDGVGGFTAGQLLARITEQMKAEEPVQPRTSYS
ncbi:MAG: sulfatase-like hydrolase/transferase [bacterium]|nr:sulfatase-like hydrolase/transferase [bacterium]